VAGTRDEVEETLHDARCYKYSPPIDNVGATLCNCGFDEFVRQAATAADATGYARGLVEAAGRVRKLEAMLNERNEERDVIGRVSLRTLAALEYHHEKMAGVDPELIEDGTCLVCDERTAALDRKQEGK
jgi:hypothetical protein